MELKELIGKEKLNKRIKELANQIEKNYKGEEVLAICVLNGAVFFATELTLNMNVKMQMEFVKISSYEGTESTGNVNQYLDIDESKISGKNILIIEDIVYTGRSMDYLVKHLKEKKPKDIKLCVLLSKPSRREIEVNIDYLGLEIPNKFVVGYGFDDENGFYRNMPYIGCK